jgi:hypothetical protein
MVSVAKQHILGTSPFACVAAFVLAASCADDTARNCLPEEEPRDPSAYADPLRAPFCDTTIDDIHNDRPEFAYGPFPITVCRDEPAATQSCDGCGFDDWEAEVLEKGEAYLAESSADGCENDSMRVDHVEPECYLQTEDQTCCYRALIWSNTCEYYVIADEPGDSPSSGG